MNEEKPYRIFLADDDEDDIFLFEEALRQVSVTTELVVASNGMELMNLLAEKPKPDLIFLDMNMPVKNGLECLEEIRVAEPLANIPVVILSTSVANYLWESAYKGGANLYVQKPTSFANLVKVLQKCLLQRAELESVSGLEQFLIKN